MVKKFFPQSVNKDITLVIMAAGMGSRFGGLKQIEKMGPNGEFIIDYSVYDAIKSGFTKIVFIIKKENYEIFKETIGKRVENQIEVQYIFQEIKEEYKVPKERKKPLGTAQAILCCKDIVNTPFAVINADDFYGREAFLKAATYLKNIDNNTTDYAMVAYHIENTITDNGYVTRGVCNIENSYLKDIEECKVEKQDNKIIATSLNNNTQYELDRKRLVSMNMLLFAPTIFTYINNDFKNFLKENKDNLMNAEYQIPTVMKNIIKRNNGTIKILETKESWYGVTYKEDIEEVRKALKKITQAKVYPIKLWSD